MIFIRFRGYTLEQVGLTRWERWGSSLIRRHGQRGPICKEQNNVLYIILTVERYIRFYNNQQLKF